MALEPIDKNTYIHRPLMETKGRTPSVKNIKAVNDVQVLTNNYDQTLFTRYGTAAVVSQPDGYSRLIQYLKSSGELLAITDAFVTDILSDGHTFKGDESKVKLAEEFFDKNNLDLTLHRWLSDTLLYGNGFLVKNFITDMQVKEVISKYSNGFETKEFDSFYMELKEYADEVATKNLSIQHLPAVTVSIFSMDKFANNIVYKQNVMHESIEFNQDEIIHLKDIDIDGKLWGYSRLYSIKSELQTLAYIKDYYGLFFENNATPDKIFIAKTMNYGSQEHKDFVAQLQDLKKPENKRKNLLALSDIDIKDLNIGGNDQQFESLQRSIVALIAMTYEMPPSRYGGSSKSTAEEATLSNQGYYRNISAWQDKVESLLNRQLFKPVFDVELKFNRNYKEDEVREVTILKTKTDVAEQRMRMDLWTREAAADFLGIKTDDMPTEEEIAEKKEELQNQFMQGQIKDRDKEDEPQRKEKINHTPQKHRDKKDN
jgi:phage portal protein BeeE